MTSGELKGLELAHRLGGKLPWLDLVWPSVNLARYGWNVDSRLALRISEFSDIILKDPVLRSVLAPNGKLLAEGDHIKRVSFSYTLQEIAEKGISVFYEVTN
jgi:gamma-glutamyltranspeptidase